MSVAIRTRIFYRIWGHRMKLISLLIGGLPRQSVTPNLVENSTGSSIFLVLFEGIIIVI